MTSPTQPAEPSHIFFGNQGLRPGWGLLLFVILFFSLSLAIQSAIPRPRATTTAIPATTHEQTPTQVFLTESTALAAVLLATLLLARIERRSATAYGLTGPHRLPLFAQGLLYGILTLSLLIATLHLTGHLPFDARLLSTPEAIRYGLLWAIAFTLVAFLEEALLRGYLQVTLTRALTPIVEALSTTRNPQTYAFWSAATILSVLFGLGHTSNPGESPLGLFSAALAGLVFCLALYRTGSLWWAIGFHTSWDWAQSFLYGVPDSGLTIQHHLLATHPTGPPILSGGLTGPEGSLFILPTLALVAAIIHLTLNHPRTDNRELTTHP